MPSQSPRNLTGHCQGCGQPSQSWFCSSACFGAFTMDASQRMIDASRKTTAPVRRRGGLVLVGRRAGS